MTEEYWIDYYDDNNKRHFTKYYSDYNDVKVFRDALERQGYKDIKIHTFRY